MFSGNLTEVLNVEDYNSVSESDLGLECRQKGRFPTRKGLT